MDKTITIAFKLTQRVQIVELNIIGTVTGIFVGFQCNEYRVRYFDNAEAKEVYFLENELKEV